MINSAPRNRVKWLVLLICLVLLAMLLVVGPDGLNIPVESRLDSSPAETATEETDAVSAETEATNTPNTTPAIARPSIDNAGYRIEGDVQILTLGGAADPQCDLLVSLGENEITPINRDSNGDWSIDVASPDVGTFEVRVECYVGDELLAFNARDLQVQAPEDTTAAADETVDQDAAEDNSDEVEAESAIVEETDAAEATDVVEEPTASSAIGEATDTPDADAEEDAAVEESVSDEDIVITGELFDLEFGNEMADWRIGYLLVRGKGTPGASVSVIFANSDGEGTVESGTLVNDDGIWAIRSFLETPGDYQVTARSGENTAVVGSVTVPDGLVYASAGLCGGGRVAPFGVLENNKYTVSDCEFFGLIAKRLAVSVGDLTAANPQIFNFNLIKAGDVVNIPPLP